MSYRQSVTQRLTSGSRLTQRQELWEKVADAYDRGGPDAVAKTLAEISESLKKDFDQALKRLENAL